MKEQVAKAESYIDLQSLLFAYLRKWWLIALCGAVAGGAFLLYTTQFVTPMYSTSVSFYVNNASPQQNSDTVSGSNLSVSRQLVETYVNIITSNRVMEKVSNALDGSYSVGSLKGMVSSSQVGDTEIFNIRVTHANPVEAAKIANTIAAIAPDEISYLIDGSSARVIDAAQVPTARSSPDYTRTTMTGIVVGCALAIAYITLLHLTDVRIKTEEDLLDNYELPILGRVPDFAQLESSYGKKYGYQTPYETSEGGDHP